MRENLGGFRVDTVGRGYLGRTLGGDRVWVTVELRRQPTARNWQTVTHGTAVDPLELGVSGLIVPKGRRAVDGAGQTIGEARSVLAAWTDGVRADDIRADDVRELLRVWERWTLNGFHAACAHQTVPAGARAADLLGLVEPCPETGYRFGTAWLCEELPGDVVAWVRAFAGRLDGTEPKG